MQREASGSSTPGPHTGAMDRHALPTDAESCPLEGPTNTRGLRGWQWPCQVQVWPEGGRALGRWVGVEGVNQGVRGWGINLLGLPDLLRVCGSSSLVNGGR